MSLKIKTISFGIGLMMLFPVAQPASALVGGWLPSIVDSTAFVTPALVSGDVFDPSGRPFPTGSSVEVVAYPSADVMKSMRDGDSIQVTPVAKAFVGPKGRFVLRLDPSVNLDRFMSSAGLVDFEVRIVNGGFYAAYSFSESVASLKELTRINSTTDSVNPNLKNLHIVSLPVNDKVRVLESSRVGLLNKTDICGEVLLSNLGAKAVAIGATFTGGAGRTGDLTYASGSSSSLGVGLSVSGAFGSYSSSGTVSRSSTGSVSFAPATGGRQYQTYFSYGKYGQYCYPVGGSYDPTDIYAYKVRAIAFASGSNTISQSAPSTPSGNCVPLASGTNFTKSTTAASTFSSGVDISSAIGVDLSSRTGYNSNTKTTFTNTSGTSKQLCGVNGFPGESPGLIVLK
jgi:hypothetical protein